MSFDIHAHITDQIIEAIDSGNGHYQLPWRQNCLLPVKIVDGTPYRGINTLVLWSQSIKKHYCSAQWGTFKAWKDEGGSVNKGEKATQIVFYKNIERENDNGDVINIPIPRYFNVWNRDQIEGLPESETIKAESFEADATKVISTVAKSNGAMIEEKGQDAFYTPKLDLITMPERHLFFDLSHSNADCSYASTLAHELIHWTGHSSRLNRLDDPRVKDNYDFEEIVAELGSAFICAELGFQYDGVADHAGYIESWLEELRNDKKAIFRAASLASIASQFLLHDNKTTAQ